MTWCLLVGLLDDRPHLLQELLRREVLALVGRKDETSSLRTTGAKDDSLLDERAVSTNAVLHWHRVGLLAEGVDEGVIEAADILIIVWVLGMAAEEILGRIRAVGAVGLDLWEQ